MNKKNRKMMFETCIHEAGHILLAHSLGMETVKLVLDFNKMLAYSKVGVLRIDTWKASTLMAGWASDTIINGIKAEFNKSFGAADDYRLFKKVKLPRQVKIQIKKHTLNTIKRDRAKIIKFAKFIFGNIKNYKATISKKAIQTKLDSIDYRGYNLYTLGLKLLSI